MRAPERARVVETLEQSLPLALGALALGAEPSPGDGAGSGAKEIGQSDFEAPTPARF